MAAIGRLDLSHSLKRLLELAGPYSPALGEGLVPTVQIADLADSPFAVSIPWVIRLQVPATAAQYGWVQIVNDGPANSLVQLDEIFFSIASGNQGVSIQPWARSILPILTGAANRFALSALQEEVQPRNVREVAAVYGASAEAATLNAPYYQPVAQVTYSVKGRWAIGPTGALAVICGVVNTLMHVSAHGRLHLTSAK
jgi:hypothetical protein